MPRSITVTAWPREKAEFEGEARLRGRFFELIQATLERRASLVSYYSADMGWKQMYLLSAVKDDYMYNIYMQVIIIHSLHSRMI